MAYIEDYYNGILLDLEYVEATEGHPLVKDSIKEQARRLLNAAKSEREYLVEMMNEFLGLIENAHDIVNIGEYDTWHRIEHKQLMDEFKLYLDYGLDAVELFESEKETENERT